MQNDGYSYRAVEVIQLLEPHAQAEIEWLRITMLSKLATNGRARVTRNTAETEYRFDWKDRHISIEFYLRARDGMAVIFGIDKI